MSSTETADTEPGPPAHDDTSAMPFGPFVFTGERLQRMEQQRSTALAEAGNGGLPGAGKVARLLSVGVKKQGTSKYRGVNLHRRSCRWDAHAWCERQVHLGCFDHEVQAAVAYDVAALKLKGNRAKLNFNISNYTDEIKYVEGLTFQEVVAILRSSRRQLLTISRLKVLQRAPPVTPHTPPAPAGSSTPPPHPTAHPPAEIRPTLLERDRPPGRSPSPVDDAPPAKRACLAASRPSSQSNSTLSHQSPDCPAPNNRDDLSPTSSPRHPPPPTVPVTYLPYPYPPLLSAPHLAPHPSPHAPYLHTPHPHAAPTLVYYTPPALHNPSHQAPVLLSYHPQQHPTPAPAALPPRPQQHTYILSSASHPPPGQALVLDSHSHSVSHPLYSASNSLLLQASRARAKRLRDTYPPTSDPAAPSPDPTPSPPPSNPTPQNPHPRYVTLETPSGQLLLAPLHPTASYPPSATPLPAHPHHWAHPSQRAPTLITTLPPPQDAHRPSSATSPSHPSAQDPQPAAPPAHPLAPTQPCYIVYNPHSYPSPFEPQRQQAPGPRTASPQPGGGAYMAVQRVQLPPGLRVL